MTFREDEHPRGQDGRWTDSGRETAPAGDLETDTAERDMSQIRQMCSDPQRAETLAAAMTLTRRLRHVKGRPMPVTFSDHGPHPGILVEGERAGSRLLLTADADDPSMIRTYPVVGEGASMRLGRRVIDDMPATDETTAGRRGVRCDRYLSDPPRVASDTPVQAHARRMCWDHPELEATGLRDGGVLLRDPGRPDRRMVLHPNGVMDYWQVDGQGKARLVRSEQRVRMQDGPARPATPVDPVTERLMHAGGAPAQAHPMQSGTPARPTGLLARVNAWHPRNPILKRIRLALWRRLRRAPRRGRDASPRR